MKIRCEQDSIRLRLRRSEMAQLRQEAWVRTSVRFPDGHEFAWELLLNDTSPNLGAEFSEGCVRISLPADVARHWMDTDQVSIEMSQPLTEGGHLQVLVEKDFPCKDRPEENAGDFFEELAGTTPPLC